MKILDARDSLKRSTFKLKVFISIVVELSCIYFMHLNNAHAKIKCLFVLKTSMKQITRNSHSKQ